MQRSSIRWQFNQCCIPDSSNSNRSTDDRSVWLPELLRDKSHEDLKKDDSVEVVDDHSQSHVPRGRHSPVHSYSRDNTASVSPFRIAERRALLLATSSLRGDSAQN